MQRDSNRPTRPSWFLFVSPSDPFAHRFDTRIFFSSHRMSSQRSDRISDARSAVAAQVSTSAKCNALVKQDCENGEGLGRGDDDSPVVGFRPGLDMLDRIHCDQLVQDADLVDPEHDAPDLGDRRPSETFVVCSDLSQRCSSSGFMSSAIPAPQRS